MEQENRFVIKGDNGSIYVHKTHEWSLEHSDMVDHYKLSLGPIQPANLDPAYGRPGAVLMINEHGNPDWVDPTIKIESQNQKHPSIQAAWDNVLVAIKEYEMMVRLCKDGRGD